jgi:hypothetical protein
MKIRSIMILCTACVLLAACRSNSNYNPAKSHHTETGFRNNYPQPPRQSFWKWQWDRLTKGYPDDPKQGYGFPLLKPDAAFLAANRSEPTLTWIGHASFLLQIGGVNVLTDPHLTERASPVSFTGPKRHVAPAFDFDTLPHADVVVISHNHYDHLDLKTDVFRAAGTEGMVQGPGHRQRDRAGLVGQRRPHGAQTDARARAALEFAHAVGSQ